MKKKVYFVRHGESEGNAQNLKQDGRYSLTELGKEQAEFLAKRIEGLSIETIISSSQKRALETAEIIHHNSPEGIIISDLFVERKNPSEVVGKHYKDPEVLQVESQIYEHRFDKDWRYSDEENFYDLIKRGQNALEFIKGREEESLLVVMHGKFLRVLTGLMIFGDDLNPDHLNRLDGFFTTSNTGITYCIYDSGRQPPWKLRTWNDHAHLGEVV